MNIKKVDNKVLIIGAELEGIILSEKLADKGYKVILIDNKDKLGGRLNNNKLSYHNLKINEKIKSIENNKNIQILKNTSLLKVSGAIGNYNVTLYNDKKIIVNVSIIVLSTEVEFVPSFDYSSDNFISFSQLINFFDPKGITRSEILKIANKIFKNVTFYVQRDSSSRYLINEFFQYALFLKNIYGSDVNLVLPDILVAGDKLEKTYREIRDTGILIYKYNNQPVLDYIDLDNVLISFKDQSEDNIKLETELLICGEKKKDSPYYKNLINILKLNDFNNINFQLLNSPRKGVYFCGLCREDLLNKECIQDAIALSEEIDSILKAGKIEYENGVINIEKQKCTLCLTCVRACPHGAIEMDRDILEERVVKIYNEACFHCGTCIGECPNKALTFKEELASI